jgi:glycosyltransferase involved in cell wall biosynthesis
MYLANDYRINVIISDSKNTPKPTFSHPNIEFSFVSERKRKTELPTTIKLFVVVLLRVCFFKTNIIIGGDAVANIIIAKLKKIIPVRHINFQLEFPDIITDENTRLSWIAKQENAAIEGADMIITHDKYHKNFLIEHFKINEHAIFLLPNASMTPIHKERSYFLHDRFSVSHENVFILLSGSFHVTFRCKELVENALKWTKHKIVLHTGRLHDTPYIQELFSLGKTSKNIFFSTTPVSTNELDSLISSAKIGIALYLTPDTTDYRARLMGLASGKIGNYLKCGVPVIATNLPSLEYLREYECGILINNESEIESAIEQILSQYHAYSMNAYHCYESLWQLDNYLEIIKNALTS